MKLPPAEVLIATGFAAGLVRSSVKIFGADADGRLRVEVLGKGQLLRVGRKGAAAAAAFERKGRNIVGVVGRQVAQRARRDRQQEEMAALVAGEVVPVAIEQMCEDLRLDLAGCESGVAVGIAFVARGRRPPCVIAGQSG